MRPRMLYRYVDRLDYRRSDEEKTVFMYSLEHYFVDKHTPRGCWIYLRENTCSGKRRWVSFHTRKRFAYPTEEEALRAYIHRKESQYFHLLFREKQALRLLRISARMFYKKYGYRFDEGKK